MKLFLDTASIDDIKKYARWGLVDGITTNPSLVAREGVKFEDRIREITRVIKGPVSAEVISTEAKGMVSEGKKLAKIAKNVTIKVPCTPEGLIACREFAKEGVKTNVTLVFSAAQALLVAKAGAALCSPFVGRVDDMGQSGGALVCEITKIYKEYNFKTEVLVASIRSPRDVTDAALNGADICTVPPKIYEQLIRHPLTDKGIEKFLSDWKKSK